jgi:hypothetical protein
MTRLIAATKIVSTPRRVSVSSSFQPTSLKTTRIDPNPSKDHEPRIVVHDITPEATPIAYTFSDVRTFQHSNIEVIGEIDPNISKLQLSGSMYCLKTVRRNGDNESFIREVTTLQNCSHPNIIPLIGIMIDKTGKVEGMIIEYVDEAKSLQDIDSISNEVILEFLSPLALYSCLNSSSCCRCRCR